MKARETANLVLACATALGWLQWCSRAYGLQLQFSPVTQEGTMQLVKNQSVAPLVTEAGDDRAVIRAVADLATDLSRVTGQQPVVLHDPPAAGTNCVLIGTVGHNRWIDQMIAAKKLNVTGIAGQWESYVLQIVDHPLPGIARALVIAGSDRRGTIYGIYELSERIGVSPWNWWADVPVPHHESIFIGGNPLRQGPPAVKYRGIFLNDEDWGLRPWAAQTFDPVTRNIGPKTYAQVFELLLRLRANYLWPAMHPGTRAFNFFPADKELADAYGIVMGSSHCEQMLRDNVDEWDDARFGEYNYVSNRAGVLQYWEQRVRENAKYESIYTLGMRGIHDGAMPGGGTEHEKAARLHAIIDDQREMLARLVNTNLAAVPQIFCPYKEVLPLYRLAPEIPDDITLVWPDDNYGYIRQYSDVHERQRGGGAGVYYHVSYWGAPRDYLWLCTTPPALIAEEMTKAFDYGADRVWMLNVGDLKPAELDIEFFLKLAWNPHAWNGTNTYDLLAWQLARDFGPSLAPELTSIMGEYYRLNFARKPEHMGFPVSPLFSLGESARRLEEWKQLSARVTRAEAQVTADARNAFFELIAYPVKAAALANERVLAHAHAAAASEEIHRLTAQFNGQVAGGKWRNMMSDNPREQLNLDALPLNSGTTGSAVPEPPAPDLVASNFPGADFAETENHCVMQSEHATALIPGQNSAWQKIIGLGYGGAAMTVFPPTTAVRATPEKILAESPCLQFKVWLTHAGDWQVTVRALPTFSVETGQPQRYAIAFDDAAPKIVALPAGIAEKDRQWQENVLRNAALTTSRQRIGTPGLHTLNIWMVDPGIVIDAVAAERAGASPLGYLWPEETCIKK